MKNNVKTKLRLDKNTVKSLRVNSQIKTGAGTVTCGSGCSAGCTDAVCATTLCGPTAIYSHCHCTQ